MLVLNGFEAAADQGRSVPDNLRQRIEQLPTKLTQLYRSKEKVALQAFVTEQQPDKVRTEIRRDQEAIARSVDYERNAEGWGGTISSIEAASATLTHVENLISFYVTRIFKKDHSFNLENWHVAWRKASKRDK